MSVLISLLYALSLARASSIALKQHRGELDLHRATIQAATKHGLAGPKSANPQVSLDSQDHFWYGNFTIGEARDLAMLIDTGSPFVDLNPQLYQPTNASKNLHLNGNITYITTQEDGCGTLFLEYDVFTDTMSQAGLTVENQPFLNIHNSTPPPNSAPGTITTVAHDGIVGFYSNPYVTLGESVGPSTFFDNLCNQSQVEECRFGLALGTDGTGLMPLGRLDSALYRDDLSSQPLTAGWEQWVVQGAVAAVPATRDDKVTNDAQSDGEKRQPHSQNLFANSSFIFDCGTANIVGPTRRVRELFDAVGIQAVEQSLPDCASVLFGYYNCSAPPAIAFRFLGGGDSGGHGNRYGPAWTVEPSAFEQARNGGDNCTAIITGLDGNADGLGEQWILGQAFYQGKYVDHDVTGASLGIAEMKDQSCEI
ncbi:aspartic peptidase domain-containing protein [Xylariaceae sp. FL0804]|nr:aspartic peptidase domain-containing protein [Xylariaceae sp. FL0804]